MTVVLFAVVLVPILTLVANMFERRGSFRVVITQEYRRSRQRCSTYSRPRTSIRS